MAKVLLTDRAVADVRKLRNPILARVQRILERLERWPAVSGARPLRGRLKGRYRLRTGDWRVVIRAVEDVVWVECVDNRQDVYED